MRTDFFTALFTQPVPRGTAAERRLAKYARYRASQGGWERTYRYNNGVAHQQACERWRLSHIRGPESYQDHNGRWRGLMKVDPADRAEAQRVFANGGGLTAAQRLVMDMGYDPDILHDEEAWNRTHARFGKELSTDHVRQFWTKKHQRWEARELKGARNMAHRGRGTWPTTRPARKSNANCVSAWHQSNIQRRRRS